MNTPQSTDGRRRVPCPAAVVLRFVALVTAVCLGPLPARAAWAQEGPLPTAGTLPVQAGQVLAPNSVHVESIRSIGGTASAYAAEGSYLYVGQGSGIAVIDATNPNDPVETAFLGPLDGVVRSIAVQDHVVYAALGEGGLAVIDAHTPAAMKVLARYPADFLTAVAVEDGRAYVADSDRGLLILDVRQPAAPALLGIFNHSMSVYYISVANQLAFLSLGNGGVAVVSVTDPATPSMVAHHYDMPGWGRVELAGKYGFAIDDYYNAHIYDFAEPAVLKEVGHLPHAGAMEIRGSYLYLAGWNGIIVHDISNPADPVLVSQRGDLDWDWVEAIAGSETLFTVSDQGKLMVFDLTRQVSPLQTGSLTLAQSDRVSAVSLDGSYLAAVSGYNGLIVHDLAHLDNRAPAASIWFSGQATALAVSGRRVLVGVNDDELGIAIFQADAGGKLDRMGFLATNAVIHQIHCSGNQVVALHDDGFIVIDVSKPAKPRQIGSYEVTAGARTMALDPPRVYVADLTDVVHIVDIAGSPPGAAQPRLLGTYVDGSSYNAIEQLAAGSDHVYLGRGAEVGVLDASDAANPLFLGAFSPDTDSISDLFYQDSLLFVHYGGTRYVTARLYIVNVADPVHPLVSGVLTPPFRQPNFAVSAGYMAFAGDEDGLATYWWSPSIVSTYPANGPIKFSPTSAITYSLNVAKLQPAAESTGAATVNLAHLRPYLPQRAQTGLLSEVIAPFTLQATDATNGAHLQPTTPVAITVRLTSAQLGSVDLGSVALYAWTGAAWAQIPSSRFDATSGELTASVSQLAPWSVRARPLTPATAVYLPFLARPGADVVLSGLEVTQSTQSLSNGVPLVAGKAALARIYATTNGVEPARDVYLSLTATRDGVALPGSPIQRGPWAVFPAWDRGAFGTSFNVPLPLDWTHGNVTLTADLRRGDGAKDGDPRNNRRTFAAQFLDVPALDLVIVPVNYIHAPSGKVYPPPAQEKITDWIARIYPIPGIRVSYHAPVTFRGDLTTDADFTRVTGLMLDIRKSENAPAGRAYYGLLPEGGSYMWGGKGFVGLRASAGGNNGVTAGHELGHNFGRLHAPCGDPGFLDPDYPYAEASIGEYGFDFGTYRIWTPAEGKDFMSYCYPRWTSDYTYLGLLADQLKHGVAAAQAADSPVLWVRAVLHEDGSAEFLPTYSLTGAPDMAPADASCRVGLLGDAGQALADHPVQVYEAADGEPLRYASAMLPLPAEPVRAATLVCDGREAVSPAVPQAVTAASTPQIRQENGRLILEWEADGPALVQYRRASDLTWTTLSVDQTDGVLAIDPDAVPGGALQLRVVRAGNAEVGVEPAATAGVELADKPPRVWITGPAAATAGASIVLFGHGFDAEDGVLEDLSWTVNGAPAGYGDQLQLAAPASGTVEVTLSAIDAAGHTVVGIHHVAATAE